MKELIIKDLIAKCPAYDFKVELEEKNPDSCRRDSPIGLYGKAGQRTGWCYALKNMIKDGL